MGAGTTNAENSPRSLGVGVVGLGWMGRLHASSYRNLAARYPELGLDRKSVV